MSDTGGKEDFKEIRLCICNGCDEQVDGIRFKCEECLDYDLCERCYKQEKHPEHEFGRIVMVKCDGCDKTVCDRKQHIRQTTLGLLWML